MKLLIFTLMIVGFTNSPSATAQNQKPALMNNGEKAGNGGGEVELDIASLLPRLSKALQQNCSEISAFDEDGTKCWSALYLNLIRLTTELNYITQDLHYIEIKAVKGPLYEKSDIHKKSPKTALNFPELNLIHVDMDRWEKIENETRKFGILTHEFIGVTGSDLDRDYAISKTLVNLIESKKWVCFGHVSHLTPTINGEVHGTIEYGTTFYGYGVDRVEALANLKTQCPSAAIGTQRTESRGDGLIYSNIQNACFLNQ